MGANLIGAIPPVTKKMIALLHPQGFRDTSRRDNTNFLLCCKYFGRLKISDGLICPK